jgi:exonuclease VII small subunit
MNDEIFNRGKQKIRNIISTLDEGRATPEEAKSLFKEGMSIIAEFESILNSYKGVREEIS